MILFIHLLECHQLLLLWLTKLHKKISIFHSAKNIRLGKFCHGRKIMVFKNLKNHDGSQKIFFSKLSFANFQKSGFQKFSKFCFTQKYFLAHSKIMTRKFELLCLGQTSTVSSFILLLSMVDNKQYTICKEINVFDSLLQSLFQFKNFGGPNFSHMTFLLKRHCKSTLTCRIKQGTINNKAIHNFENKRN